MEKTDFQAIISEQEPFKNPNSLALRKKKSKTMKNKLSKKEDDDLSKNDIKVLMNKNSRAIERLIKYKIMLRTSRF